jgi:oligopeptide transport system permease protein
MKRKSRDPLTLFALILFCIFIFAALCGPGLWPHAFDTQDFNARLLTSAPGHPLGTDALGRDLLSRLLFGARISLGIGIATTLTSLALGVSFGALAGYCGGVADLALMGFVEVVALFPPVLLAILVMAFMGPGIPSLFVALSLTGWISSARVVRAEVMRSKAQPYVEAAIAAGASHLRVLLRHALPAALGPLAVVLTYQISAHILTESFLSFLGLGVQPPQASWGSLAAEGYRSLQSHPRLLIYPGLALTLCLLSLQLLGDLRYEKENP